MSDSNKINPYDSSEYESLQKFLDTCVKQQTLFRITFVEGLLDWETESYAKSIALRVLHQFCKRRTKQELSYGKFAACFFGMALSLENVISVCDCTTYCTAFFLKYLFIYFSTYRRKLDPRWL